MFGSYEADDKQSHVRLKAIANQALISIDRDVAAVAGEGQVILSTQEQFLDGVVQYQDNTAVVIKDGQAVWVGRQLQKQKRV